MIGWLVGTIGAHAQPAQLDGGRAYGIELNAELGFLAPLSHTIQLSRGGDVLDYVKDGGQNNLFPLVRPTAAVRWRRQTFTLLWQPLDLNTTVTLDEPLTVNATTFPAGRPLDLRYGFSFWRLSWGDRVVVRDHAELTLGLGLQIRNATIGFASVDGALGEFNRDIGPVPLLELEVRRWFDDGVFVEAEFDGFYAPIKYLNGRGVDVEGAIADFQVRGGLALADPASVWLGLRYLGGGASGTGTPEGTGDGYVANWLHFLTLTVGARLR